MSTSTTPTTPIHPAMTMAVSLHDLLPAASSETLGIVFAVTGRYRLFGGKTASLLRAGDTVALRNLDPTRDEDHVGGEIATVTEVLPSDRQTLQVITAEHGDFTIPRSLLLITLRG